MEAALKDLKHKTSHWLRSYIPEQVSFPRQDPYFLLVLLGHLLLEIDQGGGRHQEGGRANSRNVHVSATDPTSQLRSRTAGLRWEAAASLRWKDNGCNTKPPGDRVLMNIKQTHKETAKAETIQDVVFVVPVLRNG